MAKMPQDTANWYCLRSQPKRERVAAAALREFEGIAVFLPQVRYTRQTPRQKRSVIEPMFPNYLFACFDHATQQRAVRYAKGVSYILRRGEELQEVPAQIIEDLRAITVEDVFELTPQPLEIGESVRILSGIFTEHEGKINALKPAAERVVVLLELLGRTHEIDVPLEAIERQYDFPVKR